MDLDKLNSATKYPSILTYHEVGQRGRLTPTIQVPCPEGQLLTITEKIDGTNGRIVLLPEKAVIQHGTPRKYLIGSRDAFLFAQGDLIFDKQYDVKKNLEPIADALSVDTEKIFVFFFEVFGVPSLPAAKEYSNTGAASIRLFDIAAIPLEELDKPIEKIASWRDHGGQRFMNFDERSALLQTLKDRGLSITEVPSLGVVPAIPPTLEGAYEWLKPFGSSMVNLGGGRGRSEGLVVRSHDRRFITKLRFEDYERTLGVKRG